MHLGPSSSIAATCGQSSFLFHRFPMDHACLPATPRGTCWESSPFVNPALVKALLFCSRVGWIAALLRQGAEESESKIDNSSHHSPLVSPFRLLVLLSPFLSSSQRIKRSVSKYIYIYIFETYINFSFTSKTINIIPISGRKSLKISFPRNWLK